jgi:hypothetical protein
MPAAGKPIYRANAAHQVLAPHARKTPEPPDAEAVFRNAMPGWWDPEKGSTWYGVGRNNEIYRFSPANDGTAHFSGMTGPGGLRTEDIPIEVRRQLGKLR